MADVNAVDAYPDELTLREQAGHWILAIHAEPPAAPTELRGRVISTSRDMVLGIAEAYAQLRRADLADDLGAAACVSTAVPGCKPDGQEPPT